MIFWGVGAVLCIGAFIGLVLYMRKTAWAWVADMVIKSILICFIGGIIINVFGGMFFREVDSGISMLISLGVAVGYILYMIVTNISKKPDLKR